MAQLQTQISAMSKACDGSTNLEDLAQSISLGLQSLNPIIWLHQIIVITKDTGIILLLLLILPFIFRLVFSSVTAKRDIYELQLKN